RRPSGLEWNSVVRFGSKIKSRERTKEGQHEYRRPRESGDPATLRAQAKTLDSRKTRAVRPLSGWLRRCLARGNDDRKRGVQRFPEGSRSCQRCLMISSANSLHFTSVAPSISRAKS